MLDVLCLNLLQNPIPMAALTKEQPKQVVDMNNYTNKQKSGYYPKQQYKYQRRINNKFKQDKRQCCYTPRIKNNQSDHDDKVPLMKKYDQTINTSYTPFTLIVHVLIIFQHIHTLYITPTPTPTSASWLLASFTQLVYVTTTCFHIATLLANIFKKTQLERAFVLYGTWVIWIGWAMCLWLIRPENRPDSHLFKAIISSTTTSSSGDGTIIIPHNMHDFDHLESHLDYLLAPMDIAPFLMHGKWSTTTLPIFSFFLLLVIRRNHWGLITWEHLVLLDYTRTLKWYRTWCVAGAGAGWMLTWEAAKFWLKFLFSDDNGMIPYKTDLPTFPGLFNVLCASSIAGIFMVCWWSFWTFQYRGVVWKKEFKEGVVVWSSTDGWFCCGSIGC